MRAMRATLEADEGGEEGEGSEVSSVQTRRQSTAGEVGPVKAKKKARKCSICSGSLDAKRSHAKTCSAQCRKIVWRRAHLKAHVRRHVIPAAATPTTLARLRRLTQGKRSATFTGVATGSAEIVDPGELVSSRKPLAPSPGTVPATVPRPGCSAFHAKQFRPSCVWCLKTAPA